MKAIEQVDRQAELLLNMSGPYLGKDQVQGLRDEYEGRRSESLLQVMIFGSYNAGKSSLINVLLGEEVAEVGDIPKTTAAAHYEWNNCRLLDTPGVNAPIEHEQVTTSEIDRSELILFVIREGDQDVKDIYERMFDLLERDKEIFIVFNHQLQADELSNALQRLNNIIADYAQTRGTDLSRVAEISVVPVNVRTAWTASLKDSERLAEHSGIYDFEDAFMGWLRRFDNEKGYLDRLKKHVSQCIGAPLTTGIEQEMGSPDNQELESLKYEREETIRQFDLLDAQVANHIRGEAVGLKPRVAGAMGNASSNFDLNADMQSLGNELAQSTADFLKQRTDIIIEELGSISPSANFDLPNDKDSTSRMSEAAERAVLNGVKSLDQEAIKKGLLALRKLKLPGVKGRWEKTLGKWAQKAGWFITAGVSIYEVWSASSEQDQLNSAERRQRLQVQQAVEEATHLLTTAVLTESRELIQNARKQTVEEIDGRIGALVETADQLTKDYEAASRILGDLEVIYI
ncbi:GTPase [Marinobacter halotolerans]|uniref:GTPase n=1 Tax=Marinobacter halotolerans TaxID=1569211 RepID=UPI0012480910|nr:GTPase [Marinobacter halotolerans]